MSKQFKTFISQLSETNATLDYFTDFGKIKANINKISIKLNQLNYLIGKEDLKLAVEELFEENAKVFEVLDILIAVRKNRGGENMSKAVSRIFDKAKIFYKKEVNSTDFPEITSLGADLKRFDFAIKTKVNTYLIETNFYNSGGSKLNEVARAYSDLAPKINQYDGYEFVWITDGQGWLSAKNKLEEAYNTIPSVYNLTVLNSFIEKIKTENVIDEW